MRFTTKALVAAALAAAAITGIAAEASAQLKPEAILEMRKGLMQAVRLNFGPVGAFAQGKGPQPADAATLGDNLVALARISPMAWAKGMESIPNSETKPEAFTSADFAKGWEEMGAAAAKLSAAGKAGDADGIKTAAAAVGKTCKSCHDNFRKE